MSTQEIPQTDLIQDLAKFWNKHDLTDFKDQLEEVSEPVFDRKTLKIHLCPKEIEAVKKTLTL